MATEAQIYDFFKRIGIFESDGTPKGEVVADSTSDILNLKEGENITIGFDHTTDTITINGADTDFYIPVGTTSLRSSQSASKFSDIELIGGHGVQVVRNNANQLQINHVDGNTNVVHVSYTQGDDTADGINKPVRTIKKAAQLASEIAYTPKITPTDAQTGAETLLLENKEFLQDEVIQYIANTYPAFSYDETKCRRDTGILIDGAIYDILYTGNSKSRLNAEMYYEQSANLVLSGQLTETIDANTFLKSLIDDVLQQNDIVPLQTNTSQIKDAGILVSSAVRLKATGSIQIVIDVLTNGLGSLPALEKAQFSITPTTIKISSGDYTEDNPIIIPDNCSIVGDSLRTVIIRPANANQNMIHLRNGSYITQITFRDQIDADGVPDFTFNFTIAFDDIYDDRLERYTYPKLPPFKPTVTLSPYIFNASLISFLGGSGVDVNGDLVEDPNVPAIPEEVELPTDTTPGIPPQGKSMIGAAYTMLTFGGTGWLIRNQAYSQLVSCFQIFALNGVYTQNGGYVSITNSATNFGIHALRAIGQMPTSFEFDRGVVAANGTDQGRQTLRIIGTKRRAQEQFIIRIRNLSDIDITSNFKQLGDEFAFDSNAITGNLITIPNHGLTGGERLVYNSEDNSDVIGLLSRNEYQVDIANVNQVGLYEDEDYRIRALPLPTTASETHKLKIADEEFFVEEVLDFHNDYQVLTLAPGTYSFPQGVQITANDGGNAIAASVLSYNSVSRELTVALEKVVVGPGTEVRNSFTTNATIDEDLTGTPVTNIAITNILNLTEYWTTEFTVGSTYSSSAIQSIASLNSLNIHLHRPSTVNSSAHTWEYAGSGIDYNALPQNGGQTVSKYQTVRNQEGRVYTSGTNELGDFLVGDFITAENKTGNISFKNKVTITELDSLSLTLSDVTINEISADEDLGDNDLNGPSHSRLVTQLAVRAFIDNHLGDFIDKNVSTSAVPSAIAQLNSAGQLNPELIPATRSFSSFVLDEFEGRLIVSDDIPAGDAQSGDIAIETYLQTVLTLNSSTTVVKGETITQTNSNATGEVKADATSSSITLVNTSGTFTTNVADELTGSTSGALSVYPTVVDADVEQQDSYFMNDDLESQFLILDSGSYNFTNGVTISGANSGASGIITDYITGVATVLDVVNLNSGLGYNTDGTYIDVVLTGGSGTGALADIVVSGGEVSSVDLKRGGTGYQPSETLSAADGDIGGRTGGSAFTVNIVDVEQRLYVDLTGNFIKFTASNANPDFIQDNNSPTTTYDETAFTAQSFDAATDVDYVSPYQITIIGHGYTNGDLVTYNSNVNLPIGNLVNNNTYRIKVISSDIFELYDDYDLTTQRIFTGSSSGNHTLTKKATNAAASVFTIASHGFNTGDSIKYTSTNPPSGIDSGTFYFIGSVTTNTFTLHESRENALDSVNGLTIAKASFTASGADTTATLDLYNVRVTGQINTSSTNAGNWSVLSGGNIDASNIISGVIEPSRLGTGNANSNTFLSGDSSYQFAVKTLSNTTADDPITITGQSFDDSGTTRYYANLDIRVENAGADLTITNDVNEPFYSKGVAKFNKDRFVVNTSGEVSTRNSADGGTIDALTLGGANRAHYENPENLSRAVPVTLGGTNLTGYAKGDIIYAGNVMDDDLDSLSKLTIGSEGSVLRVGTNGVPEWSTGASFTDLTIGNIQIAITNDNTIDIKTSQGHLYLGKAETAENAADNVDVYINGDLYVQGTTTYINTEQLNVADNVVLLNSDHDTATAATQDAGITVQRGTTFQPTPETNKSLLWDETNDKWTIGADTFVAGTVEASLTGNASSADKVNSALTAGTYLSMDTGSTFDGSAAITINHDSTTRTDTTSTESVAHEGTATMVDSITTNTEGHITAINVKTVTWPAGAVPNNATITIEAGTDLTTGGDFTTDQSSAETITIDHSAITRTDTTSTASPGHGGTFTVVDGITTNTQGHITAANVKTVTMPSESDTLSSVLARSNTADTDILPDATANNRNLGSSANTWNTVYATTFEGTAARALYADLAEKYLADANYDIGTVIAVGGSAEVTAASTENAHSVLGVVSANPAFMMNEGLEGGTYIALKGRVLVQVEGPVKKGDRLTAGPEAGIAIVDNSRDAWSFAIALEDCNNGSVEAVIL